MKRLFRHACAMLAVFLVMSLFTVVNASAANGTTIDTTNAKYGFVTVNYTSNAKLKVGIQYGNEKTSYKNCPSGKDAVFSLEQGDGTYTIFLCENISGTTYRVVTSKKVNAKIENAYAPYLIATTDVQFTSGDDVCKKAAELCKDAKTDMDKVTAIYNYIAGHYTYDAKLANDITSGKVSKYIPDTAATLNSNKGICYDLAPHGSRLPNADRLPLLRAVQAEEGGFFMYGKKTGKRLLSWVLVLIMALSMLPLNVLADEVGGDSVIYGHYEGNNWTSGPDANAPSLPEGVDSVSKTAVPTGNPNEYRVKLEVQMHTTTTTHTSYAQAAAVLVIDTSGPMGEGCQKWWHTHNSNCPLPLEGCQGCGHQFP